MTDTNAGASMSITTFSKQFPTNLVSPVSVNAGTDSNVSGCVAKSIEREVIF